jgi:hypothetical protein
MVRTALLSAVAALGLTAAAPAAGHPPVPPRHPSYPTPYPGHGSHYPGRPPYGRPISIDYRVMYRTCDHERWQTQGTYDSHYRAERVANSLRYRGYEVQVVTW